MKVLIVKNIPMEGPGTIEEFLRAEKIQYEIRDFSRGEVLHSPGDFTHLVVMGGPMAVYEMDKYTYLRDEAGLIEGFLKNEKPVLGVCLGAQMVAHVLGARVYPGNTKEIGWYMVKLTPEGLSDPATKALEVDGTGEAEVFQWHGDTFDIPKGCVRLASSEAFPNQAFVFNGNTYALQFHIEVTPSIVEEWFSGEDTQKEMVRHTEEIYEWYSKRAREFYRRFFKDQF
ncbi:MAG: amidotransferase [Nitrospirae bacterium]|nr:MAG: amidotransferase [Nitrospirota bacterium]